MNSKYVIKNCPACCEYTQTYCCEDNYDKQGRDTYCELIDDCVMKQIVNECANSLRFSCERILAEKLLGLLDIQEVL